MPSRSARSRPHVESLEERVVLSSLTAGVEGKGSVHGAAVEVRRAAPRPITVGTLGDSYTDEYKFYPPDQSQARNWVEILADTHRANFGKFSLKSRGEPRNQGFAFNWARWGATSSGMISNQLPGLIQQVTSGHVSYAWIFIGGNDFLYFLQGAENLSAAQLPALEAQLGQVQATAAANFTQAVNTLLAASPNVRLVVSTVPNVAVLPAVTQAATTPAAQALVAATGQAINQYNTLIQTTAAANPRIALVDLASVSAQLGSLSGLGGSVPFGGTSISLTTPGDNYHDFFLADGIHIGTVAQGVIGNLFVQAVDQHFGASIKPLSDTQIVQFAKRVRPNVH